MCIRRNKRHTLRFICQQSHTRTNTHTNLIYLQQICGFLIFLHRNVSLEALRYTSKSIAGVWRILWKPGVASFWSHRCVGVMRKGTALSLPEWWQILTLGNWSWLPNVTLFKAGLCGNGCDAYEWVQCWILLFAQQSTCVVYQRDDPSFHSFLPPEQTDLSTVLPSHPHPPFCDFQQWVIKQAVSM